MWKIAWGWIKRNFKLVLLILAFILFFVFLFLWRNKNKKIKDLENKLYALQAEIKLEKLAVKYNATLDEIRKMREEDEKVKVELEKIEDSLKERLPDEMTVEEIIAEFKRVGLR